MTDGYSLVLPFLTDDEKWVRGFECGMLYEQMRSTRDPIAATLHALSDDQVRVMAGNLGWECKIAPAGDGWIHVDLQPNER